MGYPICCRSSLAAFESYSWTTGIIYSAMTRRLRVALLRRVISSERSSETENTRKRSFLLSEMLIDRVPSCFYSSDICDARQLSFAFWFFLFGWSTMSKGFWCSSMLMVSCSSAGKTSISTERARTRPSMK